MKASNNKILALFIIAVLAIPVAVAVSADESDGANTFVSYYNQLDANGKAIYDAIESADANATFVTVSLPIKVTAQADVSGDAEKFVSNLIEETINKAFIALRLSSPRAFMGWLLTTTVPWGTDLTLTADTATITTVVFPISFVNYPVDPDTGRFQGMQKMLDDLDEAVNKFSTGSKSTRGKVADINKYLTKLITYDPNYNTDKGSVYAHEAYGALVDPQHYAVCDGYSKAFLLLCEKEKIECVVVLGTAVASNMENHAWNYVKMDDGEWYAIDVTWNDDSSNAYFLLGGEKFFTTHQQGVFLSTGSNPFPFNAPAINKTGYDANDTDIKEMYAWILAAIMVIVISVALYRYAKNSN